MMKNKDFFKISISICWLVSMMEFSLSMGIVNTTEASEPLIETLQKAKQSIVTLFTEEKNIAKSPKPQAVFNAKTGRLLILRRIFAVKETRKGAGIIMTKDGTIVTNAHLIKGGKRIAVQLPDGTTVKGIPIFLAPQDDVAFIKVFSHKSFRPVVFADSEKIRIGDHVINIGNSPILRRTLSEGKVIGLGRKQNQSLKKDGGIDIIQTNIRLYHGDSGGALFNSAGKFIGLMTASQGNRNSFAVPSHRILALYNLYLKTKGTSRNGQK